MLVTRPEPRVKNCLTCKNYLRCTDTSKSIIHICKRYDHTEDSELSGMLRLADFSELNANKSDIDLAPSKILLPTLKDNSTSVAAIVRKQIERTSTLEVPDIRVNLDDVPIAKNFFEWCTGSQFLKQRPYIWQAIIGILLYAEYCPNCSDNDYVHDKWSPQDSYKKFKSKVALLENGVCPHCKAKQSDLIKKYGLKYYQEGVVVAGQRSGKSHETAFVSSYMIHRLLCIKKPNDLYGLPSSNILHGTFVALTYAQAKDTLWEPLYGLLLEAPWFETYHGVLDQSSTKFGEELYNLKDTFVLYKTARIFFYPAGPDKRVLRGRTRIWACLAGDSLVSTDRGLLKIENNLLGSITHVGSKEFGISNWVHTGVKDTYSVTLKSGQTIDCTANHEIKTDRGWVRTDELKFGDKIAVSLGGTFPDELALNADSCESVESKMLRLMDGRDTFDSSDFEHLGRTRDAVSCVTSKLVRSGHLTRTYYKGRTGQGGKPRCYFEKTALWSLEDQLDGLRERSSYSRADATIPTKMTNDLASVLGYLVADGSYSADATEFYFGSSVERRLEHFVSCFKKTFNIDPKRVEYVSESGACMTRYAISYAVIKDFLRGIGLVSATAETKEIPWSILQAPKSCVAAFLAAAYDCDGGVRKGHIYYDTVSPKLAQQMQIVLQRFGIFNRVSVVTKASKVRLNAVLRVLIKDTEYKEIFKSEIGFSTNRLVVEHIDIKDPYVANRQGVVFVPVVRRKYLGKQDVYDITVDDEDHGFTANGIVVHNSIDELGWFPNDVAALKNVKMNATEVYIALERSLLTARAAANKLVQRGFNHVPTGIFFNISSPSSVRDKVMELYRKSLGSKKMLGIQRATWELNPNVTKEDLQEEFTKDPVGAMRDYGAQPPISSNAFITVKDHVTGAYTKKGNQIVLENRHKKYKDGTETRYAIARQMSKTNRKSVLALDAGISNNSFAFACGSLHNDVPVIDLVGEIIPSPGVIVNYTKAIELLDDIILKRNCVILAADRWNSLKILHDFRDAYEIKAVQYSLKYQDMVLFKDYLAQGQLKIPLPKWDLKEILEYDHSQYPSLFTGHSVEHFVLQLLTVQDTGSQVIKGDQLTDDIARAAMLCFKMLVDESNADLLSGISTSDDVRAPINIREMAVVRTSSGGGGGSSMAHVSSSGKAVGILRR